MPSTPPTPPMFSMTTGWPSSADMPCASPRPKMSAGPPAGKGTIMRIGFDGYACEKASGGTSSAISNSALSRFKLFSSITAYGHAAIDDDLGAGDEARLVGSEEQRRVRSVAPVAGEAQRDALESRFQQRLDVAAGALLGKARFHHRRMQLAGHDGIDADVF